MSGNKRMKFCKTPDFYQIVNIFIIPTFPQINPYGPKFYNDKFFKD